MPGDRAVPEKLISALTSGLTVLRHLVAAQAFVGVSRIARNLELNPSTCFNLLKTPVHEGLALFGKDTQT